SSGLCVMWFFFSSRRRHTRFSRDWSSDVCSSDLFSPDGSKVAFVRDNNLFYTDLASGAETQITQDGKFNEIINGGADWVYEEERSEERRVGKGGRAGGSAEDDR